MKMVALVTVCGSGIALDHCGKAKAHAVTPPMRLGSITLTGGVAVPARMRAIEPSTKGRSFASCAAAQAAPIAKDGRFDGD